MSYNRPNIPLSDLEKVRTIGAGTFNRVQLVRSSASGKFFALKVLNMQKVIAAQQTEHVLREKDVLLSVQHPFIVTLYSTAKNDRNLYMAMEFLPGGELYNHLYNAGKFSVSQAKFFAAEIADSLAHLHSLHVVYRDLKPENLVLSARGDVKLTDFGFAKKLDAKTFTLCGTAEYLAPEIVSRQGHSFPVDWWALGILLFEMLTGQPPFRGPTQEATYEAIAQADPVMPPEVDSVARDLITSLLEKEPSLRLGNVDLEVLQHPFFADIDWERLRALQVEPPIVPELEGEGDAFYFPPFDEGGFEEPPAEQRHRDLFAQW